MGAPSICGGFLGDKLSMMAFVWSITNVLTVFAFFTTIALLVHIHTHYRRMERYYESDDWYQQYLNNDDRHQNGGGGSHDQAEKYREQKELFLQLSTMNAKSITFGAIYTMILASGLSFYGSTAIVGVTSLRGIYIGPCFSSGGSNMRVGMFGGAIVMFANLLLVCAVILGEVRVSLFGFCNNAIAIDSGEDTAAHPPLTLFRSTTCHRIGQRRSQRGRSKSSAAGYRAVSSGANSDSIGSLLYVSLGAVHNLRSALIFVLCQR